MTDPRRTSPVHDRESSLSVLVRNATIERLSAEKLDWEAGERRRDGCEGGLTWVDDASYDELHHWAGRAYTTRVEECASVVLPNSLGGPGSENYQEFVAGFFDAVIAVYEAVLTDAGGAR